MPAIPLGVTHEARAPERGVLRPPVCCLPSRLMVARVLRDEETAREYISETLYALWFDLHHGSPLTPDDYQALLDETEAQLMALIVVWRLLEPSE